MTPLIKEYNKTASKPIGKSVEDNDPGAEAPNGYGAAVSIITGFYEKGYVDIHPEWKVMYPQDAYWKMGKTCDKKSKRMASIMSPELSFLISWQRTRLQRSRSHSIGPVTGVS